MSLYRAFLQTLGAAGLLALALACGGKKNDGAQTPAPTSATISGTVTYLRVPLVKDALGVPTGLADATVAANLQTLPARGVMVRIFQQIEQTQPDGTKTSVWAIVQSGITDSTGKYSMAVAKDRPTMVELMSSFNGGAGSQINLVAEPGGINCPTVALDRLRYALRKAADGSAPAGVKTPSYLLSADTTVDFSVGLKDAWWLSNPAYTTFPVANPPVEAQAQLETDMIGRTPGLGTGSRVLAIGDTIASFVATYGSATPGITFDLHYWPGQSEPRGSYVEYDSALFPLAFDPFFSRFRYFGSLRGGPTNDDAWDEGVLMPMLARNFLLANGGGRTYSVPLKPLFPVSAPLTDLSPDMARIEGLADVMAANLLKSPYLADTQGTLLASAPLDIREVSTLGATQLTPYSARAIRAMTWEITLKANSLPSPGTPSNWNSINPLAALRFFQAPPLTGGTTARDIEPLNVYSQLNRLKEVKTAAEPVDLAPLFTDAVLTPLVAPFLVVPSGNAWPRPTTGAYASFVSDWGTDPNSAITPLAPIALSMAKAVQVNGNYPNLSQTEVFYSGFSLSAEKRYTLSVSISPALAAGVQIEVSLPQMNRTFTFTNTGDSMAPMFIPVNSTTVPFYHPVRIRLKSPSVIQPDVMVTLALTPSL